jgi:hypothetical protein
MDTPTIPQIQSLFNFLPMKMEQTECSETLAYKIQMPGDYPEEYIQHVFTYLCTDACTNWNSVF